MEPQTTFPPQLEPAAEQGADMYAADAFTRAAQPANAMADYDFLRATYEALLRARHPDLTAIHAAFEALDAAHARLKTMHLRMLDANAAVH